jgi:hypothetical protein
MSPAPARSRTRWSPGARALVALLVVAQSFATLHLAIVPHARCAEHGELVEGVAPQHRPTAVAREAAFEGAKGEADAGHEHDEHCIVCSQRAPSVDDSAVLLAPDATSVASRAPADTELAKSPIPIVALAPKSSPPTPAPTTA